ncbi:MAG: translation initiation factor IF-2, partial [Alphaproteobacteria bacterium]|nr:translation initiation factor IF-2 [Alphaproteobacteria bacterium]
MTDTSDNDRKPGAPRGGGTLTLKRPAVEHSRVKQSFAHGRTKTVVVETKRKRIGDEAKPAPAEKAQFQVTPKVAATTAPAAGATKPVAPAARSGVVLRTLTAEEKEARDRALTDARVREAEERKRQEEEARRRREHEEHDRREREAAAKRKAEDDARHRTEEEGRRKAEEAAKKLAPKTTAGPARAGAAEEDEERTSRIGRVRRDIKVPVPTRTKADLDKRRGKLTVGNAMSDDEGERARSVAAFRRRTERLKKQAQGFQMPTEKVAREVVIPEAITIQDLANRMAERAVD